MKLLFAGAARLSRKSPDPMIGGGFHLYEDEDAYALRRRLKNRVYLLMIVFLGLFSLLAFKTALLSFSGAFQVGEGRGGVYAKTRTRRGDIVDREGAPVATQLFVSDLVADTTQIIDIEEAVTGLSRVFPDEAPDKFRRLLSGRNRGAQLRINLTPREQQAVHELGVPGLYFKPSTHRIYPQKNLAAHVVGYTDKFGESGLAGIERKFNQTLLEPDADAAKIQLTLDMRVQHIIRKALQKGMEKFNAVGAAGVLMDIHTGEILGMVSLPDFDPNNLPRGEAANKAFVNNASNSRFEPGSTMKIVNTAIALETGAVSPGETFDVSRPVCIGRYCIRDYHAYNASFNMTRILQKSSNIGSARVADQFGPAAQKIYMRRFGVLQKPDIELNENGSPLLPPDWKRLPMMTAAFGHGIALTPLHLLSTVSSLVNGGYFVSPTLIPKLERHLPNRGDDAVDSAARALARQFVSKWQKEGGSNAYYKAFNNISYADLPLPRHGDRIISAETSARLRLMMRTVCEPGGTGRAADVPGFPVIGKTGTADKLSESGGYADDKRIAAFVGAFPAQEPRYAVYVMADEPKHLRNANGRIIRKAGGGSVAAPIVHEIIAASAPLLNIRPFTPSSPGGVIREISLRAGVAPESLN